MEGAGFSILSEMDIILRKTMTEIVDVECIGGPRDGEVIRVAERLPDGKRLHIRTNATSHDCCIYTIKKRMGRAFYLRSCAIHYLFSIPDELWKEYYGKDND